MIPQVILKDKIIAYDLNLDTDRIIQIIKEIDNKKDVFQSRENRPHLTYLLSPNKNENDLDIEQELRSFFTEKIHPYVIHTSNLINLTLLEHKRNFIISKLTNSQKRMGNHRDDENVLVYNLFLNDDYIGGQLKFNEYNITIKPKKNLLLIYLGGEIHSVSKVREGERYTLSSGFIFKGDRNG